MSTTVIPAEFTLSELEAYLRGESQKVAEGHYTTLEWAERLGIGEKTMRQHLRKAKQKGMLLVSRAFRETVDGRMHRVPVYAFGRPEQNVEQKL